MNRRHDQYFKGKGIVLVISQEDCNNLYRPNAQYGSERLDFVHIKQSLLATQFLHILLKEWFFLIKNKGYLIIDYIPYDGCTQVSLEKTFWWLWRDTYEVRVHEKWENGMRFIVQKKVNVLASRDSIKQWTFGIVTNGDRDDWLELIIQSIRKQRIPEYEIIVCGKTGLFTKKNFKDVFHIPFNERSDRGWITKKKNLIGAHARFENMCIIHDRLVFNEDWYRGMKKWGNAFELLSCVQNEKNGKRAGDWITLGGPLNTHWKVSRMHYTDWDYYTYLSGQLTIIKKTIWKKVLWDETRYWNDAEDADLSFRARDLGYIARFNPYASCTALAWRHGNLPLRYHISEGPLPKDMWGRRIMRLLTRMFYKTPILGTTLMKSYSFISKQPWYRYIIYH